MHYILFSDTDGIHIPMYYRKIITVPTRPYPAFIFTYFYDTLLFFVYNPVHSQERVIHTQFLYINKKSHFIVEKPCVGVSSFVHSRPRLLWLPY